MLGLTRGCTFVVPPLVYCLLSYSTRFPGPSYVVCRGRSLAVPFVATRHYYYYSWRDKRFTLLAGVHSLRLLNGLRLLVVLLLTSAVISPPRPHNLQ